MAVTRTTRLGIFRWGDDNDPFTRTQMDTSHFLMEERSAVFISSDVQPVPIPGATAGQYARSFWLDTTTNILHYYDAEDENGTWRNLNRYGTTGEMTAHSFTAGNSAGTSPAFARIDHRHELPLGELDTYLSAYTLRNILQQKGDLYAAAASSTPQRLAVGSNNAVLVADSGETTGLRWGLVSEDNIANGAVTTNKIGTIASFNVVGQTVSGSLNVRNGVLFVSPTQNRVGINTVSPAQALDVAGNIVVSGSTSLNTLTVSGAGTLTGTVTIGETDRYLQIRDTVDGSHVVRFDTENITATRTVTFTNRSGLALLDTYNVVLNPASGNRVTFNTALLDSNRTITFPDATGIVITTATIGSITGTLGTVTLASGSITSGFGNINIGTSSLTAGSGTFSGAVSVGGSFSAGSGTLSGTVTIGGTSSHLRLRDTTDDSHYVQFNTSDLTANRTLTLPNITGTVLTNESAINTKITGTGALGSGSITSGFGNINIGTSSLTAGSATFSGNLSLTGSMTNGTVPLARLQSNTTQPCTITRVYDATTSGTTTITLSSTVGGVSVSGATGVFLSITAVPVSGTQTGFGTVFPFSLSSPPEASNINWSSQANLVANGYAYVALDSSRRFKIHRSQSVRLIMDVQGFTFK